MVVAGGDTTLVDSAASAGGEVDTTSEMQPPGKKFKYIDQLKEGGELGGDFGLRTALGQVFQKEMKDPERNANMKLFINEKVKLGMATNKAKEAFRKSWSAQKYQAEVIGRDYDNTYSEVNRDYAGTSASLPSSNP